MTLLMTSRRESWFAVEALGSASSFSAIGIPLLEWICFGIRLLENRCQRVKRIYSKSNLTGEDQGHMFFETSFHFAGEIALTFSISVILMNLTTKVLAAKGVLCLLLLAASLATTPIPFAQVGKPSDQKAQASPSALSHDLSGLWMQYPDGIVEGVPEI